MKTKLYPSTIIFGIVLSYIFLSYSNYLIRIDDVKNIELSDSFGNSFFQISHVLLFTSLYLNSKIEKFNKLLLIPIIILLVDLVPIELLHSLKVSLISTLSIIIGWITIMVNMYSTNQKRTGEFILIGVICLIVSSIPGFITLISLSNPNGGLYQFGFNVSRLDNFKLIGESVNYYQSFSLTIYSVVCILLVIMINRRNQTF
jgi:hypothetical protein